MGLWNADGMVPPPYLGKTFDGDAYPLLDKRLNGYRLQDIEDMIHHVREHGYGTTRVRSF